MSDSIRDELTKAFADAEADTSTDTDTSVDTTPDTSVDESVDTSADRTTDTNAGADSAVQTGQDQPAPAAAPAPSQYKAPQSWNAEAKGAWGSLPPQAQAEIVRRETELNRVLQVSADARRVQQQFDSIAEPYAPLLAKYNVSLADAIPPLLATRAALELGSDSQKATLVANMIADFGIDIELLDQAIIHRHNNGGLRPSQQAPVPQIDYRNVPELAPLFQIAEQFKTRQSEAAQEALSTISTHPQFDEVRHTTADVLDQARARGKTLALDAAFNIALQMHGYDPSPSTAQQARDEQGRYAAAKKAASSVSGSPKPSAGYKPGSGTIRDELVNAMSQVSKR